MYISVVIVLYVQRNESLGLLCARSMKGYFGSIRILFPQWKVRSFLAEIYKDFSVSL